MAIVGTLYTGSSILLSYNNETYTIDMSNPSIEKIKEALLEKDYDKAISLISPAKAIVEFDSTNKISVQNGEVYYCDEPIHSLAASHILRLISEGFDATPMINFLEKLFQNPSKQSVDELYGFITQNKTTITEDGDILAYKKVRYNSNGDLVDIHSGKFINNVGSIVEMPRNKVDDRRDVTCSTGLHFCSKEYLPSFGNSTTDVVIIVKVNPKDVVSIPIDYNNSKARCSRYEVVGISSGAPSQEVFTKSVTNVEDIKSTESREYLDGYYFGLDHRESKIQYNIDYSKSYSWRNGYKDGYNGAKNVFEQSKTIIVDDEDDDEYDYDWYEDDDEYDFDVDRNTYVKRSW